MQGEKGGKLGMPKATDNAKNLRLPALQKHDNEIINILRDQQQTLNHKEGYEAEFDMCT